MKLRYILTIKIVYFSILKCDYRLYKVKKGTIMDISTQYKSYIQATNTDITSEQAKKMDERKLKEAAQGLEAEFFKIFLKQSKNILLKNSYFYLKKIINSEIIVSLQDKTKKYIKYARKRKVSNLCNRTRASYIF